MKKQATILILAVIVLLPGRRKRDSAETTTTTTAEAKKPKNRKEGRADEVVVIRSAGNDMTCDEWTASISDYNRECSRVVDNEPKDLMITLDQIIRASRTGDMETVDRLTAKVSGTASGFREITPPLELKKVHEEFVRYFGNVEKAVDAEIVRDYEMRNLYMRECWQALPDCIKELKTVLMERECNEDEIKAMERNEVPYIKRKLESLDADYPAEGND